MCIELERIERNLCGNIDYRVTTGVPRKIYEYQSQRKFNFFNEKNLKTWNFQYHFRPVVFALKERNVLS